MTCDECDLRRECPKFGSSPLEDEDADDLGRTECTRATDYGYGIVVYIPTGLIISATDGGFTGVSIEVVFVRRKWWRRALRALLGLARRIFTN